MKPFTSFLLATAALVALCHAHPQVLPAGTPAPDCNTAAPILSYHVHIVYDCMSSSQVSRAVALQRLARKRFAELTGPDASCASDPDCRYDNGHLAFILDHPLNTTLAGGPFPSGEWSMSVPVAYIGVVQAWLTQHYYDTSDEFSLLIHPNTGCEYEDHSKWAVWAGQPWPLNMEIFTARKQTNEFGHRRGDEGSNPTCLPEGAACGDGEGAGAAMACCGGLACDRASLTCASAGGGARSSSFRGAIDRMATEEAS